MEIKILNIRQIRNIDWNEAKRHYSDFLSMRSELNEILENTLIELGVEKRSIKIEYSTDFLQWLNDLLPKLIKSRHLTPEEIEGTLNAMPKEHWCIIEKFVIFTPESEYLLNLIGFFIGEMLIFQNPTFYWALDKRKRSVTYKQPILWGSGVVPYLPMQMMNVVGSKLIIDNIEDVELVLKFKKMELTLNGIYDMPKLPWIK